MLVTGLPGAPGVAIGPVWRFRPASTGVAPGPVGDEAAARDVLEPAARASASQLEELAARVRGRGADDEAQILEAQALMASDPGLLDEAVVLVGLGVDELSADPSSLDGIREAIGGASAGELRGLAANALEAEDAAAVRQMARPLLERAAVA